MLNGPIYVECIIFLFYGMWVKNKILFHVKQMRCNYIDSHDRGQKRPYNLASHPGFPTSHRGEL